MPKLRYKYVRIQGKELADPVQSPGTGHLLVQDRKL